MSKNFKIHIGDVAAADNKLSNAIENQFGENSDYASGVIGPSFSTSGPGSGWSRQSGVADYAERAIKGGAIGYIDSSDGRLYTVDDDDDDDGDDGDGDDGDGDDGEWTDKSVIELICPSAEDALELRAAFIVMVKGIIDHHSAETDLKEWGKLIHSIINVAEDLSDLALDIFD